MDANATDLTGTSVESGTPAEGTYEPPRLERLGKWKALTLQQTVPIGPGNLLEGGDWPFFSSDIY